VGRKLTKVSESLDNYLSKFDDREAAARAYPAVAALLAAFKDLEAARVELARCLTTVR
jgi:hypothetical protein